MSVWAVAVAVSGALTLWLQDSAQPPAERDRSVPAPLLSVDVSALPCPSAENGEPVVCAYATSR